MPLQVAVRDSLTSTFSIAEVREGFSSVAFLSISVPSGSPCSRPTAERMGAFLGRICYRVRVSRSMRAIRTAASILQTGRAEFGNMLIGDIRRLEVGLDGTVTFVDGCEGRVQIFRLHSRHDFDHVRRRLAAKDRNHEFE